MLKTLLVHPGTQHSLALASQLQRVQVLHRLWTGVAYTSAGVIGRSMPYATKSLRRLAANRRLEGVPSQRLRISPWHELLAFQKIRRGGNPDSVLFERNERFQHIVPDREFLKSDFVIGFDTASWILVNRANRLDRRFILDRTIGHPKAFYKTAELLKCRFPDWAEEFPPRATTLESAEAIEHERSHRIVSASSFTRRTLAENGVPENKISVIPYGVDLEKFRPAKERDDKRPLRFLFLGYISGRKGVPLLLESWKSLNVHDAELWLVGTISDKQRKRIPPIKGLQILGKRTHSEIPEILAQCDVFVFPSYFEGFGLVLLEALAVGLPIITTEATAGPDLITHGVEGYLLPTGDGERLSAAIQGIIDAPEKLASMSIAARKCAERFTWNSYGDSWLSFLRSLD